MFLRQNAVLGMMDALLRPSDVSGVFISSPMLFLSLGLF